MAIIIYGDGTEIVPTSVYVRKDLHAFARRAKLNFSALLNEAIEAKMREIRDEPEVIEPPAPVDAKEEIKTVEEATVKKIEAEEKEVETWSQVLLL